MKSIRSLALAALGCLGICALAGAEAWEASRADSFHLPFDWEGAMRPESRAATWRLFADDAPPGLQPPQDSSFTVALNEGDSVAEVAAASAMQGPLRTPPPLAPPPGTLPPLAPPPATPRQDDYPSWLRPFTFFVGISGVYDSNINHDDEPVESTGGVMSVGTRFETDDFELEYLMSSHSYSHAENWSRIGQRLEMSYEWDLSDKLEFEMVGGAELKGSSDDRDLGNEYILNPRFDYDVSDAMRVRLYGAYRLRDYGDIDPTRNADNYYAGLEVRQRFGAANLDVGYRWEQNKSSGLRSRYHRQTYEVELTTPLWGRRNQLQLEFKMRPQHYWHRFVDDEEDEGRRRDVRWIFTASGGFPISRHFSIHPIYRYEKRTSNDPEEYWDAHLAILGLRYHFGGPPVVEESPIEQ